jgi:hypothetical protein
MSIKFNNNYINGLEKLNSGKYELVWDLKNNCYVFKQRKVK